MNSVPMSLLRLIIEHEKYFYCMVQFEKHDRVDDTVSWSGSHTTVTAKAGFW